MKKGFLQILFLACSYLLLGCSHLLYAQNDADDAIKNDVTVEKDVVYTTVNDWSGKMDIYLPKNATKKLSLIIFIHGGAWKSGSKDEHANSLNFLLEAGYAVASLDYRLTDQAPAPAAIEDIRCAVAYLVKNANQLNFDTSKFVMMGVSAGAHLATLSGLMDKNNPFSKRCPEANEVKIAAIIDNSGISDVSSILTGPMKRNWAVNWIGNNINNKAFIQSVSPISYVNKNSPPVFIVQANGDSTVPYEQSVKLNETLKKFNVKTQFITIPENKHVYFSRPQKLSTERAMIEFLKELGI